MKPRLLLLTICFIAFFFFTSFAWQVGQYMTDKRFYESLSRPRGYIFLLSNVITFLFYTIIAYFTFYIFYYQRRKRVLSVLVYFFISVPLMIFLRYFIEEILVYGISGYHNYGDEMREPARYFVDNIYFANYYSACGIVFFFVQFVSYNQQLQQEMVLQSRNAELSFLRSQVNPHFLFNSLNNIYTLVYKQSDNALPSIAKLSELLRYMLYEKEEKVPLEKEVQYLVNFIDLQMLRYNFEVFRKITIVVPPNSHYLILPFTLIAFIENAFKHGDLKDPDHPLGISLSVKDDTLYFAATNLIGNFSKDQTGGIGLENVRKRLELVYGNDHTLQVSNNGQMFTVNLTIHFNGR